ncbi:MAG: porin [Bacteroidaceae bacterium]|nr:porin [Bacteroidaceae bacterium]
MKKFLGVFSDIKFSGYGMLQYTYSSQEGAKTNSFNIRLARISLEGRILKDFFWKAQLQINGNTSTLGTSPRMVDYFIEWQRFPFAMIKLGQFKRPFTFENPIHPITMGFMSYSQAISKLSGFSDRCGEHASNGRDLGIQLQGDFLKNSAGRNLLHYQIGVFNGQGINTGDVDNRKDVIGGLWVMPVKGLRIGAFGWTGSYARKGNWTDENGVEHKNEVRTLPKNRYAISAEYLVKDWTFRAEYVHSQGKAFKTTYQKIPDDADCTVNEAIGDRADAFYATVTAPIIKEKLHVRGRYDLYRRSKEWGSAKTLYEIGADYSICKYIIIMAEYARVNDRTLSGNHNYNMIDVEVQLKF